MSGPTAGRAVSATQPSGRGPASSERRRCLAALLGAAALRPGTARSRPRAKVVYGWSDSLRDDPRSWLPIRLLQRALLLAGDSHDPVPQTYELTQARVLRHLQLDRGVDVGWSMTSVDREAALLPIRIPLDRGLLGWRLLLARSDVALRLGELADAAALRRERCAQGHDWPDFGVLRANGFAVQGVTDYASLFPMLQRGRIAHVPRGLAEIGPEIAAHPSLELAVVPRWILHYPAPLYFFVNPARPDLAALIEHGLRLALADGSFQQLFVARYGADIAAADLASRHTVELHNPSLPAATPLEDARLWLLPERGA